MTDDDRRLSTIRSLLAKAEATEYPDEAEAFFAKASELIGRWAIDEAMIWAGTDSSGREQPDELRLLLHAPYLPQKAVLVGAVAAAHGCRTVRIVSPPGVGSEVVSVVGFPTELRWVDTLVTSLLVQLTSAMLARCPRGVSASATASWRRSFIVGFAEEVSRRLEADRAAAAAERDATAAGGTAHGAGGESRPVRRPWCSHRAPRRSMRTCAVATPGCGRRGPPVVGRRAVGERDARRAGRRRCHAAVSGTGVDWDRAADGRGRST